MTILLFLNLPHSVSLLAAQPFTRAVGTVLVALSTRSISKSLMAPTSSWAKCVRNRIIPFFSNAPNLYLLQVNDVFDCGLNWCLGRRCASSHACMLTAAASNTRLKRVQVAGFGRVEANQVSTCGGNVPVRSQLHLRRVDLRHPRSCHRRQVRLLHQPIHTAILFRIRNVINPAESATSKIASRAAAPCRPSPNATTLKSTATIPLGGAAALLPACPAI